MEELRFFEREEFGSVRVVMHDCEPWFVASDVARALGYERPNDAVNAHCKKVNKFSYGNMPYGAQPYNIIPESDVYRLVMRSNLPNAEKFQDWVVEEVLPSIRKTGGYLVQQKNDTPESIMARAVLVAQETIKRLESQAVELKEKVQQDAPKVLFADSVAASESSILIGQLAALLRQNGVNIGQNRLFEHMRTKGFLIKEGSRRNCPTQRAMDMGLFQLKERSINNPDGSVRITMTTKVTGKGQQYFINHFLGR